MEKTLQCEKSVWYTRDRVLAQGQGMQRYEYTISRVGSHWCGDYFVYCYSRKDAEKLVKAWNREGWLYDLKPEPPRDVSWDVMS